MLVVKVRDAFFDQSAVEDKTDKAERRVLTRMGAFVRRRMKSSIRKRKRAAAPGSPPSSHIGTLKNLIYFVYDPTRKSTVVGPVIFHAAKGRWRPLSGTRPGVLEFGGVEQAVAGRRGDLNFGAEQKVRTARFEPRPFARPALEAEQPKFAAMFRNSVR